MPKNFYIDYVLNNICKNCMTDEYTELYNKIITVYKKDFDKITELHGKIIIVMKNPTKYPPGKLYDMQTELSKYHEKIFKKIINTKGYKKLFYEYMNCMEKKCKKQYMIIKKDLIDSYVYLSSIVKQMKRDGKKIKKFTIAYNISKKMMQILKIEKV